MIFALKDDGNLGAGPLIPLALFFVIFGIGACFGWETGYAINLARDFGPRLTSYMIGYGHEVWAAGGYYFWVRYIWTLHIKPSRPSGPSRLTRVSILGSYGCTNIGLHLRGMDLRCIPVYWHG